MQQWHGQPLVATEVVRSDHGQAYSRCPQVSVITSKRTEEQCQIVFQNPLQDFFHNARDGHKYAKIAIYRELQLITIFHQQVNLDRSHNYDRESTGKRKRVTQGVA